MSKRTVVSDYIQNKLNNIKKDDFLLEIEKESFYRQRILIFDEIRQINDYISLIKENRNSYEVTDGKKQLKDSVKKYIKSLRQVIIRYQNYARYLNLLNNYNNRQTRLDEKIEFASSNVQVTATQLRILDSMDVSNLSNVHFKDLVDLSKYMIENYEVLENTNVLLEMIKELTDRFLQNDYNEDDYISISSIKCLLTCKINSLDKDNPSRKRLKEIKKYIKSILERSRKVLELKHDYRYEVVEYLLDDEYYFNRLLEEMPDIVNLTDKEGYSLGYNVVSKYLDLYLLELQGKKSSASKEKYAGIYRKIINTPGYNISNEHEVNLLLSSFKETIKNGKFKRDKYVKVLNDLENIRKEETKTQKEEQLFDAEQLLFDNQKILMTACPTNRIDLTKEDTIVIVTDNDNYHNYAYSIAKDDSNNYILKVHITDEADFIQRGSALDQYLNHYMFYNHDNWLDSKLMKKFSLEEGRVSPVLTFEVKILPSGKTEDFKIYKSNISVNSIYTFTQIQDMIKSHDLNFLPYLELNYRLSKDIDKNNYGLSISDTLNTTILNLVGRYFEKNKLPYVYKAQDKQNSINYIRNMTFLNQIFTKLPKEHFNKIYRIICEDTNYACYSNKPDYHFSLNKKYYTDLFIPLYSYIGLYIQRLINEFYFQKYPEELLKMKKEIGYKDANDIIMHANEIREDKRNEKHKEKQKVLRSKQYE